jgi:two-component system sensor histidine kinase DctS
VWCNRGRLKDVLLNLLRNAIRHGCDPSGPHVIIEPAPPASDSAAAEGSLAGIRVWDNGPGISPEKTREMFLPGRRLDGAGPGSGWGLAIVRSTVEQFGGHVEWEADCPSGTAFRVTLPIASPEQKPAEPPTVEPGREWTLQLERGHQSQPHPHRHGARHARSGG